MKNSMYVAIAVLVILQIISIAVIRQQKVTMIRLRSIVESYCNRIFELNKKLYGVWTHSANKNDPGGSIE